jgi:hypothetical protein
MLIDSKYCNECPVYTERCKRYLETPSGKVLMDSFEETVTKRITFLSSSGCAGCAVDHPSQRQHTCLGQDYWYQKVDRVAEHFESSLVHGLEDFVDVLKTKAEMVGLRLPLRVSAPDTLLIATNYAKDILYGRVVANFA